jgi:hypothetical protein
LTINLPKKNLEQDINSWLRPRNLAAVAILTFCCTAGLPVSAQTSTVTDVVSTNVNATFFNGSGFSIANNGSRLNYDGPLNSVSDQSVNPTVQLTINGETLINGVPVGVAESIPNGTVRVNTLSPQLENARLVVGGSNDSVSLSIGGIVPAYTAAGGSILRRRTETADGQTFSIFPSLQPSVFNRDLAISIAEGEARTIKDSKNGTQNIKTAVLEP